MCSPTGRLDRHLLGQNPPSTAPMAALCASAASGDDFVSTQLPARSSAGELDLVVAGTPSGVMVEAGRQTSCPKQDVIERSTSATKPWRADQGPTALLADWDRAGIPEAQAARRRPAEFPGAGNAAPGIAKCSSAVASPRRSATPSLDVIRQACPEDCRSLRRRIRSAWPATGKASGNTTGQSPRS